MSAPRPQPERFFAVKDVVARFFPSRSERWVKDAFKSGGFGPVLRDGGGWLVSESAIAAYQAHHLVGAVARPPARREQRVNLMQFAG